MQMHQFCSLNFLFFFTLSRNFSLEEGKSMEKMEEISPPSDVRRIGVGQSTGRARFDGLTTNLRAATIGRYQELLPCWFLLLSVAVCFQINCKDLSVFPTMQHPTMDSPCPRREFASRSISILLNCSRIVLQTRVIVCSGSIRGAHNRNDPYRFSSLFI